MPAPAPLLPPPPAGVADAATVVILTRSGCCLCDEAIEIARAVCSPLGATLVLQDVDADPRLRADWNDHVPVTFVRGVRHAVWALEAERLRAALCASG